MSARTLEELDRVLDGDREPDDALRTAVSMLADEPGITWAGIALVDEGALALGPAAGEPEEQHRTSIPITFQGSSVGELWVDRPHVLIGWDTSGEAWEP